MDPKPIVDSTTAHYVDTLVPIEQSKQFPFHTSFPVLVRGLGEYFHVVAMDESGQEAWHVALDHHGSAVSAVTHIPMSFVSGMTTCGGNLIVTGAYHEDNQPVVVNLDQRGMLQWQAKLPSVGSLLRWPQPVCLNDQIYLIWETGTDISTFWTCEAQREACGPPMLLQFDDPTIQLNVISAAHGLTMVRTHSNPVRLELLRLVNGQILQRITIAEEAELRKWFDWKLSPLSSPQTLLSVSGSSHLHSAQFIQGDPGYLAISYKTRAVGKDWVMFHNTDTTPVRYEPKHTYEQFIGVYPWKSDGIYPCHRIVPPSVTYDSCDWRGNTLLLVHGQRDAVVSVYQGQ